MASAKGQGMSRVGSLSALLALISRRGPRFFFFSPNIFSFPLFSLPPSQYFSGARNEEAFSGVFRIAYSR